MERFAIASAAFIADFVAVALANVLANAVRSELGSRLGLREGIFMADWSLVVIALSVAAAFHAYGLYEKEVFLARPVHLYLLLKASALAFIVSAALIFLAKSPDIQQSRLILGITYFLALLFLVTARIGLLGRRLEKAVLKRHGTSLVVGRSEESRLLADRLCDVRGFGQVRAVEPEALGEDPVWAFVELLHALEAKHGRVQNVFLDATSTEPELVMDLKREAHGRGADVFVLSPLFGPLEGRRMLASLFQVPVIRVKQIPEEAVEDWSKRLFDVVVAALAVVLFAPVMLLIAVAVKLDSPGPVIHGQRRVGRLGKEFVFLKFRSMAADGDSAEHAAYTERFIKGEDCPAGFGSDGKPVFKMTDDDRVTRVGRFIRKYSLDELPQFFNVLRGEMSIVGPRPPLPYEVQHYKDWHKRRLHLRPGITGVWQVMGRSKVLFDEMVLQDLMYLANRNLLVDVEIGLRTIPAALVGRGAA